MSKGKILSVTFSGPAPEPVPLVRKLSNAAAAAGRIGAALLKGQAIRVSEEVLERRLTICRACALWSEGGNRGLGECRDPRCGCTKAKHGLATEQCPQGKW